MLQVSISRVGDCDRLTALVIPEVAGVLEMYFISVHFGIETIIFFQYAGKPTGPRVDTTPVRYALICIDFGNNFIKVPLAKGFDRYTLSKGRYNLFRFMHMYGSIPEADPIVELLLLYRESRSFSCR